MGAGVPKPVPGQHGAPRPWLLLPGRPRLLPVWHLAPRARPGSVIASGASQTSCCLHSPLCPECRAGGVWGAQTSDLTPFTSLPELPAGWPLSRPTRIRGREAVCESWAPCWPTARSHVCQAGGGPSGTLWRDPFWGAGCLGAGDGRVVAGLLCEGRHQAMEGGREEVPVPHPCLGHGFPPALAAFLVPGPSGLISLLPSLSDGQAVCPPRTVAVGRGTGHTKLPCLWVWGRLPAKAPPRPLTPRP